MTRTLTISAGERGRLRLFSIALPEDMAARLKREPFGTAALLGVPDLDIDYAEVIRIEDLGDMPLSEYLAEGYDVPPSELQEQDQKLNALEGYALVVLSLAFRDKGHDVTLGPELSLVASFDLDTTDWTAVTQPAPEAAKPASAPPETHRKRPSDAAMSGRVAMVALLVLGLLTYAMIKIAG